MMTAGPLLGRILPCVCLLVALPSAGRSQGITRIGGVMGGGGGGFQSPDATDEVRKNADTPIRLWAQTLSRPQAATFFTDQIASMYAKTGTNTIAQTHRWRYDGEGRWEREPVADNMIHILQHIEKGRYRAESLRWHAWQAEFVPTEAAAFVIDLHVRRQDKTGYRPMHTADADEALLTDGQRLNLARLEDTGEVYSYTSVLGAKTTVRLMRGWIGFLPFTYDDFCQAVSRGQTFDVLHEKLANCHACKGSGTRQKSHEERGKLGTPLCQVCRGKKALPTRVLHRIAQ